MNAKTKDNENLFGTPEEWDEYLAVARKKSIQAVKDRDDMDSETLKQVLADRHRRLYRAILINKTGLYKYHMRNWYFLKMYREGLEHMRDIKPVWDPYVEGVVERHALRYQVLEKYPKIKDMEEFIEFYIYFAEYVVFLCERAGCSDKMFSVEALEMMSTMIDEGCVKAESNRLRIIREPSFDGWQKYFGPGVTAATMGY